jgi:hypothetical protein
MAEVWPDVRQEGDAYWRIELITGRRRRQAWSVEQKARILAEQPSPVIAEEAARPHVEPAIPIVVRRQS